MVVVVLADAEDVAARPRDRRLQPDVGQREGIAGFGQRQPFGGEPGQRLDAAFR